MSKKTYYELDTEIFLANILVNRCEATYSEISFIYIKLILLLDNFRFFCALSSADILSTIQGNPRLFVSTPNGVKRSPEVFSAYFNDATKKFVDDILNSKLPKSVKAALQAER